jgi:hypothetical protein
LLTHPTIDQLHQLELTGKARAFTELEASPQSAELSHAEWLGLLLDREATDRYERRLRARLRFTRLRHQAAVEDVDYRAARGLDRALFQALIAGRWIPTAPMAMADTPVTPASIRPSISISNARTMKSATAGLRRMSAVVADTTTQIRALFIAAIPRPLRPAG